MKKRGQLKLSFGMIFSIILIIVFLAFAFYAIKSLLGTQDAVKIGRFLEGIQEDVDRAWRGFESSQKVSYQLPNKIKSVCFVDYAASNGGGEIYDELYFDYNMDENLFFYPLGSSGSFNAQEIEHIDLEKITLEKNPYCVENKKGKVSFTIIKEFDNNLVVVE